MVFSSTKTQIINDNSTENRRLAVTPAEVQCTAQCELIPPMYDASALQGEGKSYVNLRRDQMGVRHREGKLFLSTTIITRYVLGATNITTSSDSEDKSSRRRARKPWLGQAIARADLGQDATCNLSFLPAQETRLVNLVVLAFCTIALLVHRVSCAVGRQTKLYGRRIY